MTLNHRSGRNYGPTEVKFGSNPNRVTEASRERSAEQFFDDLESVAFVVEASNLGTSEDRIEPTASCINDTRKKQLVTRSGLSRTNVVYAISTTSGR